MLLTTDSASQAYEAANVVHKQVRFTSLNQRTRTNAKLLVNSCTFGRGDDRNPSAHRSSTSRQQQAPIIGNSSYSELHWTDEPRQERYAGRDFKLGGQELIVSTSYSYVPPGLVPTASSWPSTAFLDPRLTVYGGDGWPGNQYIDEAHPGPLFSAPGGNADGPGINLLMGVGVAAPALEQAFPVVQRALPASQPCPPPALNWPCQPPSSWDLPVHTVIQHGGDSASIGPLGMRPEISYSQLAAASVLTAPSGGRAMPHGPFLSVATSHSVRPSPHSDPVPVARTFLFTVISAPFRPFFFLFRDEHSHVTQAPHADHAAISRQTRPRFNVCGQAVGRGAGRLSRAIERASRATFGTGTRSHATAIPSHVHGASAECLCSAGTFRDISSRVISRSR